MATILKTETFNVALGTKKKCIGSKATKAVIDSVNKKAQNCIQSVGHKLKNVVIENFWVKFFNRGHITRPCFLKSAYKILSDQTFFGVPFLLITLYLPN